MKVESACCSEALEALILYINEFLVSLILRPTSLVSEDDIIIPAPFYIEVLRIEQRVSSRDIDFTFLLLLGLKLLFLISLSKAVAKYCDISKHTSFSRCSALSLFIFSNSRINSAVSSSSSSLVELR